MKKVFLILLLFTSLDGQSQSSSNNKPNIVWIVCEDISPFLGAYGYKTVKTPNIDQLAKEGIRYNLAFTTAGVCAPSRSAIITGMYPVSIGTQHMRTRGPVGTVPESVPGYSAIIPEYVKGFPEYLRIAGYFTTNNEKNDYQFEVPVTVWDENHAAASYRNRPKDKPFFSVFNIQITHESQLARTDSLTVDPRSVEVPPIYPDTKIARHDIARALTNIEIMDGYVGEIIKQLKDDSLYDNTIIFFYSDHGGPLPWMKREVIDRGTHIPLIIRMPGGKDGGTENNDLVSEVDFAPTVLSLAGVKIPSHLQGQAFLGEQKGRTPRKYIYAARDRMDTEYDRVRSVRDKQFLYVYNYMPELPWYQKIDYRIRMSAMMREILELNDQGNLNPYTKAWFNTPKDIEELYDTKADPWQLHNIANDPKYKDKLNEMRSAYKNWLKDVGDMSHVSEAEMVAKWWNHKDKPPVTATPVITKEKKGVRITCSTVGASIGYRIILSGQSDEKTKRVIVTWDGRRTNGKNGTEIEVQPSWEVYTGNGIPLNKGDKLIVTAMRIGYDASTAEYVQQ